MRFNIKDMKKQGIFMGILAAFLAVIILISYLTGISASAPVVQDEQPEQTETSNSQGSGNNKPSVEQVEAHSHNWVKGSTVKPTCTEGGYTINTCFCGQSKTTNEKDALGHTLGEWVTQPADSDGVIYEVRKCSVCDYSEKKEIEIENAGGDTDTEETPEGDGDESNPDDVNNSNGDDESTDEPDDNEQNNQENQE